MDERHRLERSDWLDTALDALYEEGIDGVRVEPLARRLGVTKGSFYHHFADRAGLLKAMVDRWRAVQEGFLRSIETAPARDAYEQLEVAMAFLETQDSRHDIAVRAWATTDAYARRALHAVDRGRLEHLQRVFSAMGFSLGAARLRARLIYFYQVGEQALTARDREQSRRRLGKLRYELVTRRSRSR